jgi:hypothetical protein
MKELKMEVNAMGKEIWKINHSVLNMYEDEKRIPMRRFFAELVRKKNTKK